MLGRVHALAFAYMHTGFPGGSVAKNLPANLEDRGLTWLRKILWRRKWQPTPVLLPVKFHEWRSMVGYSSSRRVGHD